MAIDSPPLTDEENAYLAEYRRLTEDYSVISDNEAQVENNDEQNVFRKEGDYWKIIYEGQPLPPIRDLIGLRYVACLLDSPTSAFRDPRELVLAAEGQDAAAIQKPADKITERQMTEDNLSGHHEKAAEPVIDRKYRKQVENYIKTFEERLEAHDFDGPEQAAEMRDEIRKLKEQLAKDIGLGGKARAVSDPHEKARKAVSKAIHRALATIGEHHSELGLHLRNTLTPVSFPYRYKSDRRIDWTT